MARYRMAKQEKKTKVNIALDFLLPVSLQRHLTSLPCTPHFGWILPGYSRSRDPHFSSHPHSCCKQQEVAVPWHDPSWDLGSSLGSFLSDWGLRSIPLLGSLVCPFPASGPLWWDSSVSSRWKPKWAWEQELAFLWSLPSSVTAPSGRFSVTATQQSCLDTRVRFFS